MPSIYENVPANAYTADGVSAVDTNSGSNTSTSCGNAGKDKHRYYNYVFNIPAAAVIKGLEVRLNAQADRNAGSLKICVQLWWNGGLTWTAPATTPILGTTLADTRWEAQPLPGAVNGAQVTSPTPTSG